MMVILPDAILDHFRSLGQSVCYDDNSVIGFSSNENGFEENVGGSQISVETQEGRDKCWEPSDVANEVKHYSEQSKELPNASCNFPEKFVERANVPIEKSNVGNSVHEVHDLSSKYVVPKSQRCKKS